MTEKNKFKNIPVEKDTAIIVSIEADLGNYEVVYQKWNGDGIFGESIIFHNDDILSIDEEEIKKEVKTSPLVRDGSKITYSKGDMYTFVNFNFETE